MGRSCGRTWSVTRIPFGILCPTPRNEDEEPAAKDKDEEDLQSNLGDDEHPVWY